MKIDNLRDHDQEWIGSGQIIGIFDRRFAVNDSEEVRKRRRRKKIRGSARKGAAVPVLDLKVDGGSGQCNGGRDWQGTNLRRGI